MDGKKSGGEPTKKKVTHVKSRYLEGAKPKSVKLGEQSDKSSASSSSGSFKKPTVPKMSTNSSKGACKSEAAASKKTTSKLSEGASCMPVASTPSKQDVSLFCADMSSVLPQVDPACKTKLSYMQKSSSGASRKLTRAERKELEEEFFVRSCKATQAKYLATMSKKMYQDTVAKICEDLQTLRVLKREKEDRLKERENLELIQKQNKKREEQVESVKNTYKSLKPYMESLTKMSDDINEGLKVRENMLSIRHVKHTDQQPLFNPKLLEEFEEKLKECSDLIQPIMEDLKECASNSHETTFNELEEAAERLKIAVSETQTVKTRARAFAADMQDGLLTGEIPIPF